MESGGAEVRIEALLAHRDWVRRVARALTSDEAGAADLEQETWLRALRDPPREDRGLRAWLGTVLRNTAWKMRRSELRRRGHEVAAIPSRTAAPPPDLVAEAEAHERVVRLVLDLEEPYRTTMLTRWFEGLPPAAMAERLGIPVETVRTRLRRALETIRERLDRQSEGDRRRWLFALGPLARAADGPGTRGRVGPVAATAAAAGGIVMATKGKAAIAAAALVAISAGAVLIAGGGDSSPIAGGGDAAAPEPALAEASLPKPAAAAAAPAVAVQVPAPAPAAAPAGIPEPIAVPRWDLRVRDVLTGNGVPDLVLRVEFRRVDTRADAVEEVRTDAEGTAEVPTSGLRSVEAVTPGWVLVLPVTDRSQETWASKAVEVRGTVRAGSAESFDPKLVTVRAVLGFASLPIRAPTTASPWKGPWSTPRGIDHSEVGDARPGPDGEYRLRVPIAPEVFVRASCPGWLPAIAAVPEGPASEGVRVDLVLDRSLPRVSLVVRDSYGNPVPGAQVQIFSTTRMRPEEAKEFVMRHGTGGGFTASVGADRAEVNLSSGGRTDADGLIAADLRIPGEVVVAVSPVDGHAPYILRLGRVDTSTGSVAVDLAAIDPSRTVRLTVGGKAFPGLRVMIVSIFKAGPQPAVFAVLDAESRFPAQYLEAGMEYGFMLVWGGAGPQRVEWTGDRDEVDFEDVADRDGVILSEKIRRALEGETGAGRPGEAGKGGSGGAVPK